jgi:hypothetical protein
VEPARLAEMETGRQACLTARPRFAPFTQVWLGEGWRKAARVYSLLFVLALAVSLTAAPTGEPLVHRPVQRARGGDVLRIGTAPRYVYFNHRRHREDYGKETSCALCHHLHKAGDVGTPCSECHRSMYTVTDIFDHTAHVAGIREKPPCGKCHGEETPIALKDMKACQECHRKDMMGDNPVAKRFDSPQAISYAAAMHRMCIACHVMLAADPSVRRPDLLARCGTCHDEGMKAEQKYRRAIQRTLSEESSR